MFFNVDIVCDDFVLSSLLCDVLNDVNNLFVTHNTFSSVGPSKDVYVLITDKFNDLERIKHINGLKVLITNNFTDLFLYKALMCGVTIIYDMSVNISELKKLGLHFYIYRRGTCYDDVSDIIKVVTKNSNFKRKYGKIQI